MPSGISLPPVAKRANKKSYLSPYPEGGLAAFLQWWVTEFSKYCQRKLTISAVGNVDDLRKQNDVWRRQNLPTVSMSLARFELNSDRGGGASRFRTIATGIDIDSGKSFLRNMAPVRVGYTVRFRTDTYAECVMLAQMLHNAYPGPTFYLEDNTGFRVECRVYLDNGVDIPQQDIANQDLYIMDFVISMTTYIGSYQEQGLIRQIKVNYKTGGSAATTLSVDVNTGHVTDLDSQVLDYKGPFNKLSAQWKGI